MFAWLTGSPYLYTIIQLWTVLAQLLACIDTSASGAWTMDCLPADDEGRPLSAARDLNLLQWANKIPNTGFPLLLAASFAWFPTQEAAFVTYFVVGGCFGLVTNLMFVFLIHPQNDKLDTAFQCTRHWYWKDYDKRRRLGLAGPERLAKIDAATRAKVQVRRGSIDPFIPPTHLPVFEYHTCACASVSSSCASSHA